eukprot:CAMPEP_0184389660 /NCGR_PEP_ID=MMETSP0007-20130409/12681_1 /TAXON_ID=97485 /ORGANISM="Prymnesium parvum, Strain Texoma1" /LENGTH=53 /DNA_ID=CAMNT_0026739091 /DNA_START=477 /DNA_END=635 /DNA_ORIENTATION=+
MGGEHRLSTERVRAESPRSGVEQSSSNICNREGRSNSSSLHANAQMQNDGGVY